MEIPDTAPARKRSQRAEQKQRTRMRLIEATMAVVAREGLTCTTLGKVARQAGLSQGIVNFHFESKDQLLAETLTQLTEEYRSIWQDASAGAGDDPAAGLEALVRALLEPRETLRS